MEFTFYDPMVANEAVSRLLGDEVRFDFKAGAGGIYRLTVNSGNAQFYHSHQEWFFKNCDNYKDLVYYDYTEGGLLDVRLLTSDGSSDKMMSVTRNEPNQT